MSNPYDSNPYEEALSKDLPPWNNILKNALPEPLRVAGQIGQSVIGDFPQNLIQEPSTFLKSGPVGVQVKSGNIFNKPENDISEYVEPKTGLGKIISTVGSVAGGSVVPGVGLAKGVKNVSKAFRTGPVRKGIKDVIKSGREVAYEGSEQIPNLIKDYLAKKNDAFGEMIGGVKSSLTRGKLHEAFKNMEDDLDFGGRDILTTSEKILKQFKGKLPKLTEKIGDVEKDLSNTPVKIEDIQALIKNVRSAISPTDHSLTVFYKHLGDVLPPELKAAKEMIKPAYTVAKQAKKITRKKLSSIAQGIAPEAEVSKLGEVASQIGSGAVSSASGLGKKLLQQQDVLSKIKRNQKIGKWALGISAGNEILNKFSPK